MSSPTKFSIWMRTNLKDAYSGLITQDIDFIVKSIDEKIYIIEEKIYTKARTGPAQAIIYKMIQEVLESMEEFEACIKLSGISLNKAILNNVEEVNLSNLFLDNNEDITNIKNTNWMDSVIKESYNYLWDGVGNPPYKKTEKERFFFRESNLIKWLEQNKLEFTSIDWIFVNYCSGYFITLFEKTEKLSDLQNKIINGFKESNIESKNPKTKASYKYLGNYFIEYNENIDYIKINGTEISVDLAISLLNLTDDSICDYN